MGFPRLWIYLGTIGRSLIPDTRICGCSSFWQYQYFCINPEWINNKKSPVASEIRPPIGKFYSFQRDNHAYYPVLEDGCNRAKQIIMVTISIETML